MLTSIGKLTNHSKENKKKNSKTNLTSLKSMFSTELKFEDKVFNPNHQRSIQNHCETDVEFVNQLLQVREHAINLQQKKSASTNQMSEQLYQFVEETGKIHYRANKFNDSFLDHSKVTEEDKCPCGCKRTRGQKLPFFINIEKQYFFGQGIILFFYFNTRTLLLMFPIVLIYGIYSLVTNLVSDQTDQTCEKPGALAFLCPLKIQSEIQNKQEEDGLLIGQVILGFVMCLVWTIGLRLIRRLGVRKGKAIDDQLISSADYFIFIEKLPIGQYSEQELVLHFNKLWESININNKQQLKIKGVQIVYNMSQFRGKLSDIRRLAKQLLKCLNAKQLADLKENKLKLKSISIKTEKQQQYKNSKREILELYEKVLQYRESFINDSEFRKKLTSQCALIEFQEEQQIQILLNHYGDLKTTWIQNKIQNIKKRINPDMTVNVFKDRQIRFFKAPQPSDIFWAHCEKKNRIRRTVIVWVLNLFCTGCSFGMLYFLKWASSQNPDLSILSIIGVNLFNRFIWNVLLNIVFIEENYTKTINITSVMNKSYFSQMINLILIPIILNVVVNDQIHGATGLAGQTHDFQITAFLFMTLFNLIYVPFRFFQFVRLVKPLRRFFIRKLCRVTGQIDTYDQIREAVTYLYDPPFVPVAGLYVYITTVISQAFFFCHLGPMLLFYLLGNLLLFFFINHYIVSRMCKITDMFDITIFHHVITLALHVPLLYGIGSILFLALQDREYNFGYYVPSIFCFIIWFLAVQSPLKIYRKLIDCLVGTDDEKYQHQKKSQNLKTTGDMITVKHGDSQGAIKTTELLDFAMNKAEKHKRLQNYYGAIGVNQIFNLENKLRQVQGKYHGKLKQFCHQFNTQSVKNNVKIQETCQILLY